MRLSLEVPKSSAWDTVVETTPAQVGPHRLGLPSSWPLSKDPVINFLDDISFRIGKEIATTYSCTSFITKTSDSNLTSWRTYLTLGPNLVTEAFGGSIEALKYIEALLHDAYHFIREDGSELFVLFFEKRDENYSARYNIQ